MTVPEVLTRTLPADYRPALDDSDLAHECRLLLAKLRPGDTLIIPNAVLVRCGPDGITPPAYPHTLWRSDADNAICVRRH